MNDNHEDDPIRTPISYARGLSAALGLVLVAGCLPSDGGSQTKDRVAVRKSSLLQGQIQIPAPQGYCVDPASQKDHARAGFVLMAGCDGLAGLPPGSLVTPAILTVSALIPQQGTPDVKNMLRALGEEDILTRSEKDGLLIVQVRDDKLVPEGSDPTHWRGAMVLDGALVTMAVYGNDGIAGDKGRALLTKLAQGVRTATAKARSKS